MFYIKLSSFLVPRFVFRFQTGKSVQNWDTGPDFKQMPKNWTVREWDTFLVRRNPNCSDFGDLLYFFGRIDLTPTFSYLFTPPNK